MSVVLYERCMGIVHPLFSGSVSYQFSDIRSHNQLSNEQNSLYPSKQVHLHEIFHKEKYLSLEKVKLMAKFAKSL